MDFVRDHIELIFGLIALLIMIVKVASLVKKARKVDERGIVTEAVVSRISEVFDPDNASSSYTTYVEFVDKSGVTRECPMMISSVIKYDKGERVKIRYIPGDYELVRLVEKISQ